ncbi:Mut7-C RNAse domain-containing protein [Paraburkholderia lacunae]|uniref:Twitching motility protein PilT n=1 Tax=Paraburkholderia lacunae TaxID=2211104 RepID=A0A370N7V4_9BURK|nr:Mut7-C RNAse domain-containing protein [Paraburkholderia lacunae]RDK01700.1 twitching motility protein PilT [Paraburkholderia lacunae]
MVTATFRFYEELNDFLARPLRRRAFSYACANGATAKHTIEALGVPHTEVELILVNGVSVGFNHPVSDGDRIAVYPKFEALDIQPLLRVRERPLRVVRFIADAHLGGLAPLLRLAGFDTLYDNHYPDADIETLAAEEHRIVLTRDRELLKRRTITHGCYIRTLRPREQLREVFERLDLAGSARPFRLCLMCNAPLRRIAKEEVAGRAPEGVLERHTQFVTCDVCRRVFWEGTHWQRMRALMDSVAGAPDRVAGAAPEQKSNGARTPGKP